MTALPVVVVVPVVTRSETNMREAWQARHRRRRGQRDITRLMLGSAVRARPPVLPLVVQLVRLAPSSGLDDDNLRGALKAIRDGVADVLRVSDRDPQVTWQYGQRRSEPRTWAVEITIGGRHAA